MLKISISRIFLNILLLLFVLSSFSCATIFNKREKKITISSDITNAKVKFNDSIYSLPSEIKVVRKKENLNLDLITDTITKNFSIPYLLDRKFKSGNLFFIYFAPVGYVVDLTNDKKYTYPSKINLTLNSQELDDNNSKIIKNRALRLEKMKRKNGDLLINIIAPSFHSYNVAGVENPKYQKSGFLGIGLGLDYYYRDNKFLNLEFTVKTNYYDFLISPSVIDDQLQIYNLGITDNYRIKRFELGYGLSTSYSNLKNVFHKKSDQFYVGNGTLNPIQVINKIKVSQNQFNLGFTTRAAYQLTGLFNVGLFFRPNIIRFTNSETKIVFESVYGMDLRFKFKVKK